MTVRSRQSPVCSANQRPTSYSQNLRLSTKVRPRPGETRH